MPRWRRSTWCRRQGRGHHAAGQKGSHADSHQWFLQFKGIFIRNLACLSQDASGAPDYQTFIANNAATLFQDDQNTTTNFSAGADLNLFGFLWDNDGKAWPGTETAELNEATQGSALDALIANMGDSYAMC